jgi:hypothetical protein
MHATPTRVIRPCATKRLRFDESRHDGARALRGAAVVRITYSACRTSLPSERGAQCVVMRACEVAFCIVVLRKGRRHVAGSRRARSASAAGALRIRWETICLRGYVTSFSRTAGRVSRSVAA